jgi:GT2 family glycosyltransferase
MSKGVLIGMACYSTEENKKDDCLRQTLSSLDRTVDFSRHKLMLSVNAATQETKEIIHYHSDIISHVFWNDTNLGTAEAINLVWAEREFGQHCIKCDDDFVLTKGERGWVDLMVEAIERLPSIGIIGLKRKDCWERPYETNEDRKSEMIYLPQEAGQRCIVVEQCRHIMGTCQMYNSALLDKIGYLFQNGVVYGHDDVLASWRSYVAGFKNVFIPYIEIDHIDPGNTPYQGWKERISGPQGLLVRDIVHQYLRGERSVYYNPFE